MRVPLPACVLLASLSACASLPPPPNQAYGAPAFDRSTRTLWLRGEPYHVPPSVNTARLNDATMVTVTWEQEGRRRVVQRYSVAERSDVSPLP